MKIYYTFLFFYKPTIDLASAWNGNVVSAVIGLTVAGVFSLLSDKPKKQEVSGSFVSLRVIDKVKKTDNVKIYDTFFDNVKADTKKDLLRKINETINIDPDSKEYNINWYNNFRLYKEIFNYFYYF